MMSPPMLETRRTQAPWAPPSVESRWVSTAGSGPSVLLLHGWTMDGRVWAPQLSLQEEFHLIVPNRRGCGLSSAPPSLEQESDDILRLLNRCAVERVVVMGERGGGVARRSPKN